MRWLELFVSRPLGDPLDYASAYPGGFFADDPTAQACPWAVSLYVGAATLALATAAHGRLAKGLLAAGLLALLLALGRHLPVHAWARALVPPLALARYPEKHVAVACDALAVLASLGVSRLLRRQADVRWPVLVALLGLGALVPRPQRLASARTHGRCSRLPSSVFSASRSCSRVASPVSHGCPPSSSLAMLLGLHARWLLGRASQGFHSHPSRQKCSETGRAFHLACLHQPREFTEFALLPLNAATLFGIGAVPGEDSARTPELGHLIHALSDDGPRTWELLRASHLIAPVPNAPSDAPPLSQWKVVRGPERPRAWMVAHAVIADGAVAQKALTCHAFDVEAEATVSQSTLSRELLPLLTASKRQQGGCNIVAYRSSSVDLSRQAPAPALVVLADGYAEGWHASVDGSESALLRADLIYRGTVVAPGTHRVRFWYEPPGLVVGALLALLGALLALLAALRRPTTGPIR